MERPCGLERISPKIHDLAHRFGAAVASAFEPYLRALTLFGAVTSDSFDPRRDSIRSVVVVEKTDLGAIFRLGKQGRGFAKQRIAAPWILSSSQINASLDTFPLELIEVQQEGATILGQVFFGELAFQESHVRLQCEREVKTALIALHQGVLSCAGDERSLRLLASDTALGLSRTLGGLLWLNGVRERRLDGDRVAEIERACGRELGGLRAAMSEAPRHDLAALERLYHDVEALGEYVNVR